MNGELRRELYRKDSGVFESDFTRCTILHQKHYGFYMSLHVLTPPVPHSERQNRLLGSNCIEG